MKKVMILIGTFFIFGFLLSLLPTVDGGRFGLAYGMLFSGIFVLAGFGVFSMIKMFLRLLKRGISQGGIISSNQEGINESICEICHKEKVVVGKACNECKKRYDLHYGTVKDEFDTAVKRMKSKKDPIEIISTIDYAINRMETMSIWHHAGLLSYPEEDFNYVKESLIETKIAYQEVIENQLQVVETARGDVPNKRCTHCGEALLDDNEICFQCGSLQVEVRSSNLPYPYRTLQEYRNMNVDKYQILAGLDLETCNICANLDTKVFMLKDAQVGVNVPPFHEGCRCDIVPYTEWSGGSRTARGLDGKTYYVNADWNYQEWYKNDIAPYIDSVILDWQNTYTELMIRRQTLYDNPNELKEAVLICDFKKFIESRMVPKGSKVEAYKALAELYTHLERHSEALEAYRMCTFINPKAGVKKKILQLEKLVVDE